MGQHGRAGGARWIYPIDSNGVSLENTSADKGRGVCTLTAGATYYYILGGKPAPFQSIHLTGKTAALILTSASIQGCDHDDVLDKSSTAGEWPTDQPTTAYVSTDGTGWSATNGVLAVVGGNLGGARWNDSETGVARKRLAVVVGGTGGDALVSWHGKD